MLECGFIDTKGRDDLFVEISFNDYPIGEVSISDDKKGIKFIIYQSNEIDLSFDCNEFIEILQDAYEKIKKSELEYWKNKGGVEKSGEKLG